VKKRYRRRLWAGLLAVLLLLVGVSGAFRAGVHLGYHWGAMPAPNSEEAAPQAPGPRWGPPMLGGRWHPYGGYWGRPTRGGFLGRFLSLLLVLLGVGALLKVFRHKAWHLHRAHGPHPHGPWSHGPWGHGPWDGPHPCGGEPQKTGDSDTAPADEQVAKVQPEPDAD
jgi:hypothetical protein